MWKRIVNAYMLGMKEEAKEMLRTIGHDDKQVEFAMASLETYKNQPLTKFVDFGIELIQTKHIEEE